MSIIKKPIDVFKEYAPDVYISLWPGAKSDQAMYQAAAQGHVNYLEALLTRKKDPNFLDVKSHKSPLLVAVENDQYAAIQMLLKYDTKVDLPDSGGRTPLEVALNKPKLYSAGLLLARNPNLVSGGGVRVPTLNYIDAIYKEPEKKYIFAFIGKYSKLDETVNYAFDFNRVGNLKGIILAHKPTAEKVFFEALRRNHTQSLEVMLEKYGEQISDACSRLDDAQKKLLITEYDAQLYTFLSRFKNEIPQNLEPMEQLYNKSLEPLYSRLQEIYPEYEKLRMQYAERARHGVFNFLNADEIPFEKIHEWAYRKSTILRALIGHVETKIGKLTNYIEHTQKCCICFEEYRSNPHIIVCKNGHSLCVGCFNNPTIENCPMCRQVCHVEKLELCQMCAKTSSDLKAFYCKDCSAISMACPGCKYYVCCKKERSNALCNENELKEWVRASLKYIREKQAAELGNIGKDLFKQQQEAQNQYQVKIDYINKKLKEIHEEYFKLKDLPQQMREEFDRRKGLPEYCQYIFPQSLKELLNAYKEIVDRITLLARWEKEYIESMRQIQNSFSHKIQELKQQADQRADQMKEKNIKKIFQIKHLVNDTLFDDVERMNRADLPNHEAAAELTTNQLLQMLGQLLNVNSILEF